MPTLRPTRLREIVEARLGGERSPGSAHGSPTGGRAAEGSLPRRLDPEAAPAPRAAAGQMGRSTRTGDRVSLVLAAALLVALTLLFVPWSSVRSGLIGHGGHGGTGAGHPVPEAGAVPRAPQGRGGAGVAFATRILHMPGFDRSMPLRFTAVPLPGAGGQGSSGSSGPSGGPRGRQGGPGDEGKGHDNGHHNGHDHHHGHLHHHQDRGHHEGHDRGKGGGGPGQGDGDGDGDRS